MQIKKGKGIVKALEIPDALAAYNTENGVIRARLIFSFVGAENIQDTDDLTAQLLSRTGNNTFSVIIDITDIGLDKAKVAFVGKNAHFTVLSFTVAELTGDKFTIVNNGEREYSSLSSPHIGEADEKTAFETLVKRLRKDLSEGKLFLGELPKGNTPQQQPMQQPMQQPPTQNTPPAQGSSNFAF